MALKKYLQLFLMSISIFTMACKSKIENSSKVAVVGKIVRHPVGVKNGAKKFAYVYNKKCYFDVSSFDARKFTYGDKFLLYIDKGNPRKKEIPRPVIKFFDTSDISAEAEQMFKSVQANDLLILDSIPVYK